MIRKGHSSLELTIENDISISKIKTPKPKFLKIFAEVFKESHMVASIISETLRPFPRFIRTILLFTEIYLQLLFSCIFVCL